MKRKNTETGVRALLLDIVRRSLLGIVAVAIFFESCTKYEALPQDLPPRSGGLDPVAGPNDSKHIALPLSAEDIEYWQGLHTMLQRVLDNPKWAETYMNADAVTIDGIEKPVVLDDFTKSLLRLFADNELRTAISKRDYSNMLRLLQTHRGDIQMTEESQRRVNALLKADPKLAALHEQYPDCVVVAIAAVAVGAIAVVVAAIETLVAVHSIAWFSTRVHGCIELMPINYQTMAVAIMAENPELSSEAIGQMQQEEIKRIMQALQAYANDLKEDQGKTGLQGLLSELQ